MKSEIQIHKEIKYQENRLKEEKDDSKKLEIRNIINTLKWVINQI